jgi:hypothetical protein
LPTVDEKRLLGNYGAGLVSYRLSKDCLVRSVTNDTDVGVDLYCESVAEDQPFLHFWLQVKAGLQVKVSPKEDYAKCSFQKTHLEYWNRQPVPVFAALVPTGWPVEREPKVYIIDITSHLITKGLPRRDSQRLKSHYIWEPNDNSAVTDFVKRAVPWSSAILHCRNGVISLVPSPRREYVHSIPMIPATQYADRVLTQIRLSAAMTILAMRDQNALSSNNSTRRRTLAGIVLQFSNDGHWENFMALALSAHADRDMQTSLIWYEKALNSVLNDDAFMAQPGIDGLVVDILTQISKADAGLDV